MRVEESEIILCRVKTRLPNGMAAVSQWLEEGLAFEADTVGAFALSPFGTVLAEEVRPEGSAAKILLAGRVANSSRASRESAIPVLL